MDSAKCSGYWNSNFSINASRVPSFFMDLSNIPRKNELLTEYVPSGTTIFTRPSMPSYLSRCERRRADSPASRPTNTGPPYFPRSIFTRYRVSLTDVTIRRYLHLLRKLHWESNTNYG